MTTFLDQDYTIIGLCPSSVFLLETLRFGSYICFRPQVKKGGEVFPRPQGRHDDGGSKLIRFSRQHGATSQ